METQKFLDFVQDSPTAFHAVHFVTQELLQAGYLPLQENELWQLTPGRGYFVTRNQSSLIAFWLPETWDHFQITASHSDSPMFKLKPNPTVPGPVYTRLNVEKYGGAILFTWMDRPLSIAGRVLVSTENGIQSHLVGLDDLTLVIPNLPIHFNRGVNEGVSFNVQTDMFPVLGDGQDGDALTDRICKAAGVQAGQILGADLFLYNQQKGRKWGAQNQYFSAPRIDDLECAYTALQAFLSARPDGFVPVYALFDNEEVGSLSGQGAGSTFLPDILTRLCSLHPTAPAPQLFAGSFLLSCDNAHALHPNHPEKYDEQNRVLMNQGVVLKSNAAQKYTTNGVSAALFQALCQRAGVNCQLFANRSDIPGGSTLGNIANSQVSMCSADIGLAQLAMHSAYESAGCQDLGDMIRVLAGFYRTAVCRVHDGQWEIR